MSKDTTVEEPAATVPVNAVRMITSGGNPYRDAGDVWIALEYMMPGVFMYEVKDLPTGQTEMLLWRRDILGDSSPDQPTSLPEAG